MYENYYQAMEDTRDCIGGRGFVASLSEDSVEPHMLVVGIETTDATQEAADQAYFDCFAEHAAQVSAAWADFNVDPDNPLQNGDVYGMVVDCVAESTGEDFDHVDPSRPSELSVLIDRYESVYMRCFDEIIDANL